jgi:hypothetical protein
MSQRVFDLLIVAAVGVGIWLAIQGFNAVTGA